jgi:exosortase family protein XrtF
LRSAGFEAEIELNSLRPTVFIKAENKIVISVFEGCNGLNVMIVFVAFVLAYSGPATKICWFVPGGLILIHAMNLFRVAMLYYMARFQPLYFYYFHKYLFTAFLYAVVFGLWWLWIYMLNGKTTRTATS